MAKDMYADQLMQASEGIRDQIMQGIQQSERIQSEVLQASQRAAVRGERQRRRDVAAAAGEIIPFGPEDMQ